MKMTNTNIEYADAEDEDIVIAGSELHTALSKLGYSDFEVLRFSEEQKPTRTRKSLLKEVPVFSQVFRRTIINIYRWMIKDSDALKQHVVTISGARHLLDDHSSTIKSFLLDDQWTQSGKISSLLPYLKYVAIGILGYYVIKDLKPLTWLTTLPALTAAQYKYIKWQTNRNLKALLSEQTELYYAYKRALRILHQSFIMKTSVRKRRSKFTNIDAEKLKCVQPILEETLKSLTILCNTYYETTLSIVKLLPDSCRQNLDSQITYFEKNSFEKYGEVTYEDLKQIFFKFILIQSEMLLTLAVLCNSEPSDPYNEVKCVIKVEKRIKQLLKLTEKHRFLVTRAVNAFHNCKLVPIGDKNRGFPGSKWQDLYVPLHLTSLKVQSIYNSLTSVLDDVENHIDRQTGEAELLEILKTKLDDVCKDVDKARDLTQLSALILASMRRTNHNPELVKVPVEQLQPVLPIVRDTDPVINDEVFEDYIRDRCSDVLNQSADDYLERTYKLDKFLSRNLMSELKEALVEKQKETQERESRALERMNKSSAETNRTDLVTENHDSDETQPSVTAAQRTTDARQSPKICGAGIRENETRSEPGKPDVPPPPPPMPMPRQVIPLKRQHLEEEEEEGKEQGSSVAFLPRTAALQLSFFLAHNEEIFIGSGENSDEESLGNNNSSEEIEDETNLICSDFCK